MPSTCSVQVLRGGRKVRAKVDRGAGGVDGAGEVAPPALDTHGGLVDTPARLIWRERNGAAAPSVRSAGPSARRSRGPPAGRAAASRNGSDECLLHDFSKLTPTSTTVATRLKGRAFDTFQSLTGLVVSRKYLRVGEEKARGRQPARRAAAPQPPAAGVADQPVSQTAVCDTPARTPPGTRRRVSYPMSDSMSCRRRARGPVPCGVHGRMASVIAALFSSSRPQHIRSKPL